MSKISEFFGLYCRDESLDFKCAMESQICPYTQKVCTKMRKSDPDIKIGTCSVRYQGQDIIICPFRLLEQNQRIEKLKILLALNYKPWTQQELFGLNARNF